SRKSLVVTGNSKGTSSATVYKFSATANSLARRLAPMSVAVDSVETFPVFAGVGGNEAPAATIGEGQEEGVQELVAGQVEADGHEVYRLPQDTGPQRLASLSASDGTGRSASSNMAIGDVAADEPGDEIVIAEDGMGHRASRLRVFGGYLSGAPHLV